MDQTTSETRADIDPNSPVLTAPQGMKLWSVIVTILGDLLQDGEGYVSGLTLTALIERMGLQPQAMRVALHRLKRDGWIESTKQGRVGFYRLSDMGRQQIAQISSAIYGLTEMPQPEPMLAVLSPAGVDDAPDGAVMLARRTCLIDQNDLPGDAVAAPISAATLPIWAHDLVAEAAHLSGYLALNHMVDGILSDLHRNKAQALLDRAAQRMLVLHSWRRLVLRSNPVAVALMGDVPVACRSAVLSLLTALPRPQVEVLEATLTNSH